MVNCRARRVPSLSNRLSGPLFLGAAALTATALPAIADPPIVIKPTLRLEEAVTDNARITEQHKILDAYTTVGLDFTLAEKTQRTRLDASGTLEYQKFVTQDDLDGLGLDLHGTGGIEIVPRSLYVDAAAAISDALTNNNVSAATSRRTEAARTRVSTYSAGPTFRAKLGDYADMVLAGRYAEIRFDNISPPGVPPPPELTDSTFLQGDAVIATKERPHAVQMIWSGQYIKQNQGFISYDGLYSVFVPVIGGVKLIGRVGYEHIFDPGVTKIDGLIWSGGFITTPGRRSSIRVEYGSRFKEPTWDVDVTLSLSPRIYLAGIYRKSVETEQSRLQRTLTDIKRQTPDFPIADLTLPQFLQENLINATFLSEDATLNLVWALGHAVGDRLDYRTYLAISAYLTKRHFFELNADDKLLGIEIFYNKRLGSRLALSLDLQGEQDTNVLRGQERSNSYRTQLGLTYDLAADISTGLTYTLKKTFLQGGGAIPENEVRFGVSKAF